MPSDSTLTREEHCPDGTLKARWSVRISADGTEIRQGAYESFYPNGSVKERGNYVDGEPVEPWTTFDEDGRVAFSGIPELGDAPEPDEDAWDEPIVVPQQTAAAKARAAQWLELCVVLVLGWLPFMVSGLVSEGAFMHPSEWSYEEIADDRTLFLTEIQALATSLQVFIVLMYIISRSDLRWRDVGVVKPRVMGLLLLGPLLAVATLVVDAVLVKATGTPNPPGQWFTPSGAFGWGVLCASLTANSLAEEFVWRGYVLTRVKQLTGSVFIALTVSSVLFASYHIYQGPLNASFVVTSGLIWGGAMLLTRRIWPVLVAHTLHNLFLYTSYAEWLYG